MPIQCIQFWIQSILLNFLICFLFPGARAHPSSSKDEVELSLAAKTANKLFGPCTVQKVQLKNGQTVFAYNPRKEGPEAAEASTSSASTNKSPAALQTNANGIRNLSDIFNSVFSKKKRAAATNRKRVIAPEEIVLSDSSDDETAGAKSSENASRTSSPSKKNAQKRKNDDEQNQGDKEDSPGAS